MNEYVVVVNTNYAFNDLYIVKADSKEVARETAYFKYERESVNSGQGSLLHDQVSLLDFDKSGVSQLLTIIEG